MSRQVSPAEVRELLAALPRWFPAAARWSVKLANHGPGWMPQVLRGVPLRLACWLGSVYARRLA
ncbi:hypothetical protein [Polaromonas eurypsychrophila]|uniref:Uncharacterized protein n=1 Tax=Polaromonas eurypsychrophila TaxID=1614635 RepID=A0A916SN43_9BURK|nr:hypothetical protein [Polaromonas eurypsychrophila]GGB05587.1 hypothetical protein GCM10011496_28150 [Polaromonas eurypsychrophila]